jgi:hypothetical protein
MADNRGRVVLVTGAAPYLGGPATWSHLRECVPEFDFIDVDLLDAATGENIVDAARRRIETALSGAHAIVAHGTAARAAIEAVARVDSSIPVILLSPLIVSRQTILLGLVRVLAGMGGNTLASIARTKRRRLLVDESYLRKQLNLLVRSDLITDELLNEARARIADSRTDLIVARTAEMLRGVLTPIDPRIDESVSHRMLLLGEGPMDRRARARGGATVVKGAWAAPMLETPLAVAESLRAIVRP